MNLNVMQRNIEMQESITKNKLAYSVEEISAQTSLSKAFLRLEIKRGNLKAVRPGNSRRVIITAKSLEDYLNEGENNGQK
jgi:excisionase family DNA binding protein